MAVSFFGGGAVNIGALHEGIDLAAVKSAPIVFVCQNNQYAASTHISLAMRVCQIPKRAESYGIQGHTADGMDVLAVHESARQAIERARAGEGPTLLEYLTYRYAGHSRGDPGGYRTKEELRLWREKTLYPDAARSSSDGTAQMRCCNLSTRNVNRWSNRPSSSHAPAPSRSPMNCARQSTLQATRHERAFDDDGGSTA